MHSDDYYVPVAYTFGKKKPNIMGRKKKELSYRVLGFSQ